MTGRLDSYAVWGDWDLQGLKVEFARWRDTTHPPDDTVERVTRWWPRLKQSSDRTGAVRVGIENDLERNLWWMWVPHSGWLSEERGYFRVQCFFRVYESDHPPRLVCVEFRTVRSMTPTEVDFGDGMG